MNDAATKLYLLEHENAIVVKPLSEKTLEFNVTREMIAALHGTTVPQSYVYGYSLKYETRTGLDVSIDLPGGNSILSFQFKKAYAQRGNVMFFEFNNNMYFDQHNFLYAFAFSIQPIRAVYYALPAFFDISQLESSLSNLVASTYFVDPLDVGPINDGVSHDFQIDLSTQSCIIHSDMSKEVPLLAWEDLGSQAKQKTVGMGVETLKARISDFRVAKAGVKITGNEGHNRFVRLSGIVI